MRNIITYLGVWLLFGEILSGSVAFSQQLRGDGKLLREERTLHSFDKIHIDGTFFIILYQSEEESVSIEADGNLLPYINTEVNQGELRVSFEQGVNLSQFKKMNVTIHLKDLHKLYLKGENIVKSEGQLILNHLDIIKKGSGTLDLNLSCETLTTKAYNSGSLILVGATHKVEIFNMSKGKIYAKKLIGQYSSIQVTGTGNVTAHAEEEIDIFVTGTGSLLYTGEPKVSRYFVTGKGKVKKI